MSNYKAPKAYIFEKKDRHFNKNIDISDYEKLYAHDESNSKDYGFFKNLSILIKDVIKDKESSYKLEQKVSQ